MVRRGTSGARNRPDKDGTHRAAFDKNKKRIYATQTVCALCGRPVDFSLKFPHPMSATIDHIVEHQIKCTKKIKLNAKRNNVKFHSIQII